MSRYRLMFFVVALVSAVFLSYDLVAANTSADFGGGNIRLEANRVQEFVLGPVLFFVAVCASGYGLMRAMFSQSLQPLVTFGGLGLGASALRPFIEGVFGMIIQ